VSAIPDAKILGPQSVITKSKVRPCALWIVIAKANMRVLMFLSTPNVNVIGLILMVLFLFLMLKIIKRFL